MKTTCYKYEWMLIMGLTLNAQAATIVEQKDAQGQVQQVILDGTYARMTSPKPQNYLIAHLAEKKLYSIDTQEKRAIEINMQGVPDMNTPLLNAQPAAPTVKAQLHKVGEGETIAGYPTLHYQILADTTVCANVFLSPQAGENPQIKTFIRSMFEMNSARRKQMVGIPVDQEPCKLAMQQVEEEHISIGMPLKSINPEGTVQFEVVSIKTEQTVPADTFTVPTDFKVLTEEQMLENVQAEMMKHLQKMQENQTPPAPTVPNAPTPPTK